MSYNSSNLEIAGFFTDVSHSETNKGDTSEVSAASNVASTRRQASTSRLFHTSLLCPTIN
jgi:hypothetical protein